MLWGKTTITVGMGVTTRLPGSRYQIDVEVIEVYDTHVIGKMTDGRELQVSPSAILAVLDQDVFQANQVVDNNNLKN